MIGIRPARPQDAFGIATVHVETWRATYPTLLPHDYLVRNLSIDTRAAYWQRTLDSDRGESVLVAVEAGTVVGFCSVGAARKRPGARLLPEGARLGEVFTLYVLPDFQDRGAGRMLLANGFARLLDMGCQAALLWVIAANPSRFFYEAMGGQAAGSDVEKFAGARLEETCYLWPDLPRATAALAARTDASRRAQS